MFAFRSTRTVGLLALLASVAYVVWSRVGRGAPAGLPNERYGIRSIGEDCGRGNLLGMQPWLEPADYASAERLCVQLAGYFRAAAEAGLLGERTIVILPEYLGTWLALAGEKTGVYRAQTLAEAVRLVITANLPGFLWRLPAAREAQWAMTAVLRMKAKAMAAGYHHVMSTLAHRYRIHLVAGSIVLPEPSLRNGVLHAGQGTLYNTAILYAPNGRAVGPLVRKAYPTEDERPLLRAGCCRTLPVFDTPAGRLGILICADAWYPACYAALEAQQVDLVAVPSFDPLQVQGGCWQGYSGWAAPSDVDPADIGTIPYATAWRKYALATRLSSAGARAGLNVFFHGSLWEMHLTGHTTAVAGDEVTELPIDEQVPLVNLWL